MLNNRAFGPVWLVDSVAPAASPDDEIAMLSGRDLALSAVIGPDFFDKTGSIPCPPDCEDRTVESYQEQHDRIASSADGPEEGLPERDSIELTEYAPNALRYHYRAATERLAVFSEIYYPGWNGYLLDNTGNVAAKLSGSSESLGTAATHSTTSEDLGTTAKYSTTSEDPGTAAKHSTTSEGLGSAAKHTSADDALTAIMKPFAPIGNAQPVDILRADWTLRAAVLPAGEHDLVMRFEPTSYRTGARISRASSILLLLLVLASLVGLALPSDPVLPTRKETRP